MKNQEAGSKNRPLAWKLAFAPVAMGMAFTAHAAGGHYSVDDAVILEPTQCQFEGWVEGDARADHTLAHGGRACRVGNVELGAGVERSRIDGETATTANPQVKWATSINERLSVGVYGSLNLQNSDPRYSGTTLNVPVSYRLTDSLQTHVNLGRDFNHGAPDQFRSGIALEWEATERWLLLGERFRQGGTNVARAGVRWEPTEALSFDISRTREIQSGGPGWWTLGVSWAFERRRPRANILRRIEKVLESVSPGTPAAKPAR